LEGLLERGGLIEAREGVCLRRGPTKKAPADTPPGLKVRQELTAPSEYLGTEAMIRLTKPRRTKEEL
jgi:hypothetical protein